MAFKNLYLSYSRLSKFKQCRLAFKLHYIDKLRSEPGIALLFGSGLHKVIELLTEEHVDNEECGALSQERALELWQTVFANSGMVGSDVFAEGASILRRFVADQGIVDARDVLGIEKEFKLPVGDFTVLGFIDRLDRVDDETIKITDWKSNRMLFSREEVDSSLQMSIYHVAVKRMFPWVKRVQLSFYMLRHGICQNTERTDEQLEDALRYIEAIGKLTETATEYPATINTNCGYCDHRSQCPAYAEALKGDGRRYITTDLEDLEAVAKEREEVAAVAKLAYSRKEELDRVLKKHLEHNEQLELGGVRYRMFVTNTLEYPLEQTARILAKAAEQPFEDVVTKIASVDKKAMESLLKTIGKKLDKPRVAMLKAELEAHADKTSSTRLWAKKL